MTGGIGFSRAGMDSSRNNRNLLKDSMNRNFIQIGDTKENKKIIIEKADPRVLEATRLKTEKTNKRRKIVIVTIASFTLLFLTYFIVKIR